MIDTRVGVCEEPAVAPPVSMSALGQKQTWPPVRSMSALPPKADIGRRPLDVRFVPKADILHCSNDAGLLGQVLPNFRQQFSFDTYFFAPASGKIHIATIMKVAVASTKFPNSGRPGEPLQ